MRTMRQRQAQGRRYRASIFCPRVRYVNDPARQCEDSTSDRVKTGPRHDKRPPSKRTLRGLDWVNFFLADVQTGVGPFLAIYLAAYHWNEQRVGLALTVGGLAGIVTQTPDGAMVDRVRSKRALLAAGVVALAAGAMLIAFFPSFWPVMTAQVLIGGTSSIFIPVICAISLGIVGQTLFDCRQGRNQTFNSAGNVTAAVSMGLIGYYLSNRGIFFFVVALAVPTILCLRLIDSKEIDYDLARNAKDGADDGKPARVWDLRKDRPLLVFLCSAVLFHFANAAMLPLLGEMLAKGKGLADIADALGISYKTVANTCTSIKHKLLVERTSDLIRVAVEMHAS